MKKKQSGNGNYLVVETSIRDPFEDQTNNAQVTQLRTANSENFTEDAELAEVAPAFEPSRFLVYQGLTSIKTRCSKEDRQVEVKVDDGK